MLTWAPHVQRLVDEAKARHEAFLSLFRGGALRLIGDDGETLVSLSIPKTFPGRAILEAEATESGRVAEVACESRTGDVLGLGDYEQPNGKDLFVNAEQPVSVILDFGFRKEKDNNDNDD